MLEFFFFILLLGIMFSFQPFISSGFVPSEVRVPLLLLFTFLSIAFSFKKKWTFYFLLVGGILFLVLFLIWIHNSANTISDIVYVIVLSIFTYCLYPFLKRMPLLVWILCRFWLFLLLFISVFSIGGFITYNFNLLPYTFTQIDPYSYYFNPIFGYVFVKAFGSTELGRACWYMWEPSYLAFFLTTNYFFISSLPFAPLVKNVSKLLIFLGAFCALSTGSWVVFSIVFFISAMYWIIKKLNFSDRMAKYSIYAILLLSIVTITLIPKEKIVEYLGSSSYNDRDERLAESLFILGTSNVKTIFLGHAPGYIEKNFEKGESNQFMKLIIEEGFLLMILIIAFIIFCLKKNFKFMLATIIFLNSVVILWTPLICINIILCKILTDPDYSNKLSMNV